LEEARKAESLNEVPVGALVLTPDFQVIASGHNSPISSQDPTAHAEIVALRRACRRQGNYRLTGSIIVCTLEPCCMCVGALVQARISGVVFGTRDPKAGALVSRMHFPQDYGWLNHSFWIQEGVCGRECSQILQGFFARRRAGKKRDCPDAT
jgi:tRNA(adenine34) deaminase